MRLFLIIINLLISPNLILADESPLKFYPIFSTNFFSSGSIFHQKKSGSAFLSNFSLNAKKSINNWEINGVFKFTTTKNTNINSSYFIPELNYENQRGYYNNEDKWFESSELLIKYQNNKNFNIFFGKNRIKWGNGNSSLILSKNTPAYPMTGFNWDISNSLRLEYFVGILSSLIEDTLNTNYIDIENRTVFKDRGIAAHRLIWDINDYLTLLAMETVIYGNRKFDEHYLFPFIPFWSMQHYIGDIDNVQMCGELNWKPIKHLSIYSSLFIDEWRPEWTFDTINRNWFGYQIGLSFKDQIIKNDSFIIEYTWTDHRIYRHKYPINDSFSFNYALGFWAGPHAEEFYFNYRFPIKEMIFETTMSNTIRGQLTDQMISNQYQNIKDNRFAGGKESRLVFSTRLIKNFRNEKIMICIEGQWIDWDNAGFNPYNPNDIRDDISKFSMNIKLRILTELIWN